MNRFFIILLLMPFSIMAQELSFLEKTGTYLSDILPSHRDQMGYPNENSNWYPPNDIFIGYNSEQLLICIADKVYNRQPQNQICLDAINIVKVESEGATLWDIYPVTIFIHFKDESVLWIGGFYPNEAEKIKTELKNLKDYYLIKPNENSNRIRSNNPVVDDWIRRATEINEKLEDMRKCFNSGSCKEWIYTKGGKLKASSYIEEKTDQIIRDWSNLPIEYVGNGNVIDMKNNIVRNLELMKTAREKF